jgi:hypothetical protein
VITRVQPAPAQALQMQMTLRASRGIACRMHSEIFTLEHQHGIESVAPQSFGFPHSGQTLVQWFFGGSTASLSSTSVADAFIIATSRFSRCADILKHLLLRSGS